MSDFTEQFLAKIPAATTERELRHLMNYAETDELVAAIILRGREIDNDPEIEGSRQWLEDNGQFGVGV